METCRGRSGPDTAAGAGPAPAAVCVVRLHTRDIEACGYCGLRRPVRHAVLRQSAPESGGEGEASVCPECLARGYAFLCEHFAPQRLLPGRGRG